MEFTISDAFLPATLSAPPMTDEQFADFCAEHPDLFFEMTAQGEIVVMRPNFTFTGIRNREIIAQLDRWSCINASGIVGESSTGFVLPSGARRSPDACWTSRKRIATIAGQITTGYWHLCPEFVIELRSDSDKLRILRDKMREWITAGAHLAWLIDPETRAVEIYRPNREPDLLIAIDSVAGEGPVEGFTLDLRKVWDPLA